MLPPDLLDHLVGAQTFKIRLAGHGLRFQPIENSVEAVLERFKD